LRIPLDKWADWWAAADTRITKMGGDPEEEWIERRLNTLYDMGQNIDILLEWATGAKDINIFELPGGENCSGLMASFFGCGFDAIGWEHLYPFKGLPHVHETADVGPGHFGMVPKHFRRVVNPDEQIKAGYVKLHMNWDEPNEDVIKVLVDVISAVAALTGPLALLQSISAVRNIYKKFDQLFRDSIKITQRDRFKIPHPFWKATHVDLIWRIKKPLVCVGQEAFLKQYRQTIDDLREGMKGDKPRYIVLAPTFLYG
jgi:hypothetical protein